MRRYIQQRVAPRLNNDRPGQPAQILILFAIAIPLLFGLLGIGIDAIYLFSERRSMQGAADLAALAGAAKLPSSSTDAIQVATTYASSNGFTTGVDGVTVTPTSPYNGATAAIAANEKIEVKIARPVRTFFMAAFGFDSVDIEVRAVAYRQSGGAAPYVFFASRPDNCNSLGSNPQWSLTFTGGNDTITGAVHSNGHVKITGGSYKFNLANPSVNTMVCNKYADYGTNYTWNKTATNTLPVTYSFADFACNFTVPNSNTIAAWSHPTFFTGQQLKDGVYCSQTDINLGWVPPGTKATFVAKGRVNLTGGITVAPYANNVLIYSESNGNSSNPAVDTRGGGISGSAIIYAPNGHVKLHGGGMNLKISVFAYTIEALGGGSTFTQATGGGTATAARLIA